MIAYVKRPVLFDPLERISINNESSKPNVDPLKLVNKDGNKLLDKLTHFVSRQNLIHFMYEQELSEEGSRKMRRLIFPKAAVENKKTYSKDVVESLQKSIVE